MIALLIYMVALAGLSLVGIALIGAFLIAYTDAFNELEESSGSPPPATSPPPSAPWTGAPPAPSDTLPVVPP